MGELLNLITDLHMAKKEMTYLYELAEFLLVLDLQTVSTSEGFMIQMLGRISLMKRK